MSMRDQEASLTIPFLIVKGRRDAPTRFVANALSIHGFSYHGQFGQECSDGTDRSKWLPTTQYTASECVERLASH
jgi:hypothetical protein